MLGLSSVPKVRQHKMVWGGMGFGLGPWKENRLLNCTESSDCSSLVIGLANCYSDVGCACDDFFGRGGMECVEKTNAAYLFFVSRLICFLMSYVTFLYTGPTVFRIWWYGLLLSRASDISSILGIMALIFLMVATSLEMYFSIALVSAKETLYGIWAFGFACSGLCTFLLAVTLAQTWNEVVVRVQATQSMRRKNGNQGQKKVIIFVTFLWTFTVTYGLVSGRTYIGTISAAIFCFLGAAFFLYSAIQLHWMTIVDPISVREKSFRSLRAIVFGYEKSGLMENNLIQNAMRVASRLVVGLFIVFVGTALAISIDDSVYYPLLHPLVIYIFLVYLGSLLGVASVLLYFHGSLAIRVNQEGKGVERTISNRKTASAMIVSTVNSIRSSQIRSTRNPFAMFRRSFDFHDMQEEFAAPPFPSKLELATVADVPEDEENQEAPDLSENLDSARNNSTEEVEAHFRLFASRPAGQKTTNMSSVNPKFQKP